MYSTTSEMEAARGFLRCYVEKARRREEFRSWTTIVEFADCIATFVRVRVRDGT